MTDEMPDSSFTPNADNHTPSIDNMMVGLRDAVQTLSGGVETLARKNWWDRLLIKVGIVVSVISLLLIAGLLHTSLNTCHSGNAFRRNETQLWDHFLTLPPTHVYTPEEIRQREEAKVYIARLFAQRNCSLVKTLVP